MCIFNKSFFATLILFSSSFFSLDLFGGEEIPRETVMLPGMIITAKNKSGTITISYVDPIRRNYKWDSGSRTVKMIVRKERFQHYGTIGKGILGLYEPAAVYFFSWKPRLVVQEAEKYFQSEEEVRSFLRSGSAIMDPVFTEDGLVVGFSKIDGRGNQINVDVWQIFIKGEKAKNFFSEKNKAISVQYAKEE
jgi:hypothetical protein